MNNNSDEEFPESFIEQANWLLSRQIRKTQLKWEYHWAPDGRPVIYTKWINAAGKTEESLARFFKNKHGNGEWRFETWEIIPTFSDLEGKPRQAYDWLFNKKAMNIEGDFSLDEINSAQNFMQKEEEK